ncbi:MAG: DUF167 domain-containing protein [Vitreoscilla sp.]|jgi:uncharacterized protein (TIGR00251 family)|nr:DUF167 domain-containing protein [Vitreoscilla sp.]
MASTPPRSVHADTAWPCLRADGAHRCVLTLAVSPNARRTEVQGLHDGALKLRLAAMPVEGQANTALLQWLAEELDIPKRDLRLRRGVAARHKQVEIDLPLARLVLWLAQRCPAS